MLQELAEYEKMPESVKLTNEQLAADLKREALGAFVAQEVIISGVI